MARLVVFKSAEELEKLRDLLYGDHGSQQRGLALCKAYESRGQLPPSIHVTCLIISALHSDVPTSDLYAIRLTYAMALIRFVNEILDAAQVGKAAVPLHALATDIQLPNAFVELRHAATHEDVPSIYLLRDMANRALDWLWDVYWRLQQEAPSPQIKSVSPPNVDGDPSERIKELLKQWRRLKRSDASAVPPASLVSCLRSELVANESEFLTVVLTRNILIPAGTGPIPKQGSSVVALWLPLFQKLGYKFCQNLAGRVVSALSLREWPIDPSDSREVRKYPLLATWAETLAPFLSLDMVKKICATPRPWNACIAAVYASKHASHDVYATATKMAQLTGVTIVDFPQTQTVSSTPGWVKVQDWSPRPLGVL